jgi:hypothetical protein
MLRLNPRDLMSGRRGFSESPDCWHSGFRNGAETGSTTRVDLFVGEGSCLPAPYPVWQYEIQSWIVVHHAKITENPKSRRRSRTTVMARSQRR